MLGWLINLGFGGGGGLTVESARRSSVQVDLPWFMTGPNPDGTLDQGDRQHMASKYSGILAGGAVTPPVSTEVLLNMMNRGLGWGFGSGLG